MQATSGSGKPSRIDALQALTAALSRAPTVDEVTAVVVTTITEEFGAGAAMVALLEGDDAPSFKVARAVGYLPSTLEQWRTFPMDSALPAGDALQRETMVLFESLADRDQQYPALRGAPAAHESWAIVPLIADGQPLGILSLGFTAARRFEAEDRSFVRAVSDQCAQALHRAQLYDEQRTVARRRGFLNQAGASFAEADSYGNLLQLVVELATPALSDGAALFVGVPGGLRPAAVRGADPTARAVLARLSSARAFSCHPVLEQVFHTSESCTVGVREALSSSPRGVREGDVPDEALLLILPLRSRSRTIGVLVLVSCEGHASDWCIADSYSSLAALHCDNARLLEEQTRIVQRLQSSLLPPMLPQIPGVEVAAAYTAAGSGSEVGGDFYDVFKVGEDRWFAVTGDVRGRGMDAAATTGLARHAVRAAAAPCVEPSAVVVHLNEMLLAQDPAAWEPRFCAVCVIALTPTAHGASVTLCCAGHPLPWLITADGTARELGSPGTVAGVVLDPEVVDAFVTLSPGDTLVAFTDGISERRCHGTFFEDRVGSVLSATAHLDASTLAHRLRDQAADFAVDEPDDDMAVLVLRIPSRQQGAGVASRAGTHAEGAG